MKIFIVLITCMLLGFASQAAEKEISLTEDNTLILDQAVSMESVGKLMEKASKMDAKLESGYPIYLFLYTPGGSIQAGVELIEYLEGLNRPVHTVSMFAASMGFQIIQHMGKRYVTKYAVLMSHKARGSFSGSFGGGIGQMDTRYSLWLRRIALMDKQTVERTNGKQTLKSYINAYSPELWLNGTEAVEQGYADEVVNVKCDDSLNSNRKETIDLGFVSFEVVLSNCPLRTAPVSVKVNIITNKGTMPLEKFLENDGKFNCSEKSKIVVRKKARRSQLPPHYAYEDEVFEDPVDEVAQKEDLCSKDPSLSLGKILKKKTEIMSEYTKDLQENIVYSY